MNYSFNMLSIAIVVFIQLSLSQDVAPVAPALVESTPNTPATSVASTPNTPSTSTPPSRLLFQLPSCRGDMTIDCAPCEYTQCPAYPNAICRNHNCGWCSAIFYDHVTGNQLSFHLCNTPTDPISTTPEPEEEDEEEEEEAEYPLQVDQYQKTRDNYGVNLNDEMIDIGRDLINYGDLDINVAWPYDLQSVLPSGSNTKFVKLSQPCTPNKNKTISLSCICVNTTNGTIYLSALEEIGDDPVVNRYTIDNVQKTRDNMGLNLNDEVVDIGRDLVNYGTLHYNMVPVSSQTGAAAINSVHSQSPCSMVPCLISPCKHFECPLYPLATCRDDFCGGCNAKFTDPETGKDLSRYDCHGGESPAITTTTSVLIDNAIPIPCEQDEKICPDGTVVFRQSMDNCEFAACPIEPAGIEPAPITPAPITPAPAVDTQENRALVPQSAVQTKEQLDFQSSPCRKVDRNCNQDLECCGDGICDINGKCVIINNDENDPREIRIFAIIIMICLVIIIICILPLFLYWCYCKQCNCKLANTKIEPRREVLEHIDNDSV